MLWRFFGFVEACIVYNRVHTHQDFGHKNSGESQEVMQKKFLNLGKLWETIGYNGKSRAITAIQMISDVMM